jgi:hypothetical protein
MTRSVIAPAGAAWPTLAEEEIMNLKATLLAAMATATLACGATACGAAGSTPTPVPSRSAPAAASASAVAFCVGGFPAGAPQYCGIEPAQIYFSGDESASVREITWSSWKESGAAGRGTWYTQTCLPNCAQGPVIKYPATLTLSAARHGMFTVLVVTAKGQATTYRYPEPWALHDEGCTRSPACDQVADPSSSP